MPSGDAIESVCYNVDTFIDGLAGAEECLEEAMEFNVTETQAYAGCYVDVQQQNFVPREERRPRGRPPIERRSW